MFGSLGNLLANIGGDLLGMPQGVMNELKDVGSEIKNDPMKFLKDQTGISDIMALSLPPDEYAKYLAENPGSGGLGGAPVSAPTLPYQNAPYAPTGGFVGQTPNYLNFAQQSIRGPYG